MISKFGQFVRQLRIARGELLKNMADSFGVSPAFLSAVECGKKSVPANWKASLVELYKLSSAEEQELQAAIDESQRSLAIDLSKESGARRSAAVAFARDFEKLSDSDLEQIRKTMADLLTRREG